MAHEHNLARNSLAVAVGTLASRASGVVRVAITLAVLGNTLLADVYNSANTMPNVVYELFLGGIFTASLMPVFIGAERDHDVEATTSVISTAVIALLVVTVIALFGSPIIAEFLTRNVAVDNSEARGVATLLVTLFIPQILFYGFSSLAGAVLNARRRFFAAAVVPVLNNLVVIAVMLMVRSHLPKCGSQTGACRGSLEYASQNASVTIWLGLGTTAGISVMALALFVSIRLQGVKTFSGRTPWRHPAVRRLLRLSGWTVGYVAANQIASAYILWVAPRNTGSLTQYQSALIFFQLPHGLVAVSIMTAVVPDLVEAYQAGHANHFVERYSTGLRYLLIATVPAAAGYLVLARPLVRAVLGHGQFTEQGLTGTTTALVGFAIGLVPFSVYLYSLRAFYARGDTRTPFILNCGENVLNIVLVIAFFPRFGVGGLAIAYSMAYLAAAAVALFVLHRSIGNFPRAVVIACFARAAASAAAAALAATLSIQLLGESVPATTAACLLGVAVYATGLIALRSPELAGISAILRRNHH